MTVRFAAWNLAHQTKPTEIPDDILEVLRDASPDIVVLTAIVPLDDGEELRQRMKKRGYVGFRMSNYVSGQNRVVIAARVPVELGDLEAIERTPATRPNFLHAVLKPYSLDVIGMRVPMFDDPDARKDYWNWIEAAAARWSSRRLVVIGDLNADPKTHSVGGRCLGRLAQHGWTVTDPVEPWSYATGTRLDHALVAPGLVLEGCSFVTEWRGTAIVKKNGTRLSDHALLIVDIGS